VVEEAYWTYPIPTEGRPSSPVESVADELRERLEESVRLRLMSDVPLGAMLSGGLDSSLIVALMAKHVSGSLKTFSVGFQGIDVPNELDDALAVSRLFDTEHYSLSLDGQAQIDFDDLIWQLDEPVADLSTLGFLQLSKLAREQVTVALSGQGADELFAGYRKHKAAALAGIAGTFPGTTISALLSTPFERLKGSGGQLAKTLSAKNPASRMLAASSRITMPVRRQLLKGAMKDYMASDAAERFGCSLLGERNFSPLNGALFLDAKLGLTDDMLHYFDRASMAHSLEVRVPFLDHEFVEFSAGIPPQYKIGPRLTTKHVLKLAAKNVLPDSIVNKPKIGFFHSAIDGWIRTQLKGSVGERLRTQDRATRDIFDQKALDLMIAAQEKGHAEHSHTLLVLLMLELWLSTYLPRAMASP
ncbi:MAG: asparagine synthetase B family protein, partial [Pseudomonadales bacterium]